MAKDDPSPGMMWCPGCDGKGWNLLITDWEGGGKKSQVRCERCNGSGEVPEERKPDEEGQEC